MFSRLRRPRLALGSSVLAAAVAIGLLGAGQAIGMGGVGSSKLAFTQLHAGNPFANPPEVILTTSCDPNGTSTITFDSNGTQVTTRDGVQYGASFHAHGTLTFGPQTEMPSWLPPNNSPPGPVGAVTSFQESFTIHFSDGRVASGTKTLENDAHPSDSFVGVPDGFFSWAVCRTDPGQTAQTVGAGLMSTYAATITNADQSTSDDSGVAYSFLNTSTYAPLNLPTTYNFGEFLGSGYVGPYDDTAPVAHPTQTPAAGPSGLTNGPVTINWNWTDDGGVGIDPSICDQTSVSYGSGTQTFTALCFDIAGNIGRATYTVDVVNTVVTIGPQAMNGNLKVSPGQTLNAGYSFAMPGNHPAATLELLNGGVSFAATCLDGTSAGTIVVPFDDTQVDDPAGSGSWYPDGKPYQGGVTVPDLCNGGQISLKAGGTFSMGVLSTDNTDKVNFRWHYGVNGGNGGWSATRSVVPDPS
jgi:hypothetical protein